METFLSPGTGPERVAVGHKQVKVRWLIQHFQRQMSDRLIGSAFDLIVDVGRRLIYDDSELIAFHEESTHPRSTVLVEIEGLDRDGKRTSANPDLHEAE